MEEAKGMCEQLDLFPEISGMQGSWLLLPFDFGHFAADLEAFCLEYARFDRCRATSIFPRQGGPVTV